jgi:hypothetical protein
VLVLGPRRGRDADFDLLRASLVVATHVHKGTLLIGTLQAYSEQK